MTGLLRFPSRHFMTSGAAPDDVIFVAMVKTNGEIGKAVENIIIASDPSHVIIHTGTNNLPAESADSFVTDI